MGLKLMRSGQWQPGGKVSVDYEGYQHNSQVTLIIEDMPSPRGPRLHKHPYGESLGRDRGTRRVHQWRADRRGGCR
jgi:hypothetical protein